MVHFELETITSLTSGPATSASRGRRALLDDSALRNVASIVRQEDLQVGGVNGRVYPVVAFGYNPQTFTATWRVARPLESDRVSVSLSGGVTDRGGTPIGGAGYFRGFNVEPGDATRDLRVNGNDVLQIRARHGRTTLRPGTGTNAYSIFHDLTGDGVINVLDLAAARRMAGA